MPQILVDAGRFQGLASTCCTFQTIIYPKGATGSHFNLWCLLRWDIAGFKTGSRVGTTLTNLYTQQTWINFKPTKKIFQRITFILIIVSSCWHLKHVSKRGAEIASNITPDQMYFAFNKGHWKGGWEFEATEHGKLMSKQVTLYQEIQTPGMDVVPYTLPVYPHPAGQRFPFLIHSPV